MFDIEEELKKLPHSPGVYLMRDSHDNIIYVGKAVSLHNRVRSYFRKTNKTAKIEKMVTHIARFEYIVTDSELEALILECNLIKEHTPKYNTMLKDGKTYPFIKVSLSEAYPRITKVRRQKRNSDKYFGPYVSNKAVNDTISLLQKIYHFRTCHRVLPRDIGKERPCLNSHIGLCSSPCSGRISKEEYRKNIGQAMEVLNGNYQDVEEMLKEKMYAASEAMEYEDAAQYRDLIESVRAIAEKQKITATGQQEDRDIIAYSGEGLDAIVQVFFIRNGKMLGREHFHLTISPCDTGKQILTSFIKQYYAGNPFIPREIVTHLHLEDQDLIEKWLEEKRGAKVTITIPEKGSKKNLVKLAMKNAKMVLEQDREKIRIEEIMTKGAVKEIEGWLGLKDIVRMEAYDISNISGFESVGSMIVYEDGKPKRNDYRKFKIKWVKGADDYASMHEVLTRRFTHGLEEKKELEEKGEDVSLGSFTRFPDLIMMDGGRGQVNVALDVLKELHLDIPVCGMVKDDHHRTRGLYYNNVEIPIDTHSGGFKLITRVQDEAHRFAIEYHRSLRSKGQVKSILDDIEGIGPTRRKALMRKFKSVEAVRDASLEELIHTESMNEASAESVYRFFH